MRFLSAATIYKRGTNKGDETSAMTEANKTFTTSDIGIAAYLQLRGNKLVNCTRENSGKFRFEFDDSSGVCRAQSLEFLESDFCKFDNIVRNLKKILYRN